MTDTDLYLATTPIDRDSLLKLLASTDLGKTTPKQIRALLERKLGLAEGALEDEKDTIKRLIQEFVNNDDEIPALRKMATALRVSPAFWTALDKDSPNYKTELQIKLVDVALAKGVVSERRLPTEAEMKKFKKRREREADLDGLSTSNIVSGKRSRTADLFTVPR